MTSVRSAILMLASALLLAAAPTHAADMAKRKGWIVQPTTHSFADLVKKLEESVKANKMNIVNVASATDGAKAQGFTIPGNRVVGVFRNDFARRMLTASVAAGIEAPVRIYLTENADGKATLSYRPPSAVFAPYLKEGGKELRAVATELDTIFAAIAIDATKP